MSDDYKLKVPLEFYVSLTRMKNQGNGDKMDNCTAWHWNRDYRNTKVMPAILLLMVVKEQHIKAKQPRSHYNQSSKDLKHV